MNLHGRSLLRTTELNGELRESNRVMKETMAEGNVALRVTCENIKAMFADKQELTDQQAQIVRDLGNVCRQQGKELETLNGVVGRAFDRIQSLQEETDAIEALLAVQHVSGRVTRSGGIQKRRHSSLPPVG